MADQLPASALPVHGDPVCRAPAHRAAGRGGDGVRECLLHLAAVRAIAGRDADRPAPVRDRGLRQRGRAAGVDAPPSPTSLRAAGYATCLAGKMHFVGPDQLHGFERAADHRRVPGRLRLDARLAAADRRAGALVPQHGQHPAGGRARGGDADRLRRRGGLPLGAAAARPARGAALAAVLPHRLVHEPARSLGGAPPPLGAVRGRRRRPAGGGRDPARAGRPPQPAAARHVRQRPAPARPPTRRALPAAPISPRSATWTSGWARCWRCSTTPAWPATPWCC